MRLLALLALLLLPSSLAAQDFDKAEFAARRPERIAPPTRSHVRPRVRRQTRIGDVALPFHPPRPRCRIRADVRSATPPLRLHIIRLY